MRVIVHYRKNNYYFLYLQKGKDRVEIMRAQHGSCAVVDLRAKARKLCELIGQDVPEEITFQQKWVKQ